MTIKETRNAKKTKKKTLKQPGEKSNKVIVCV